MLKLPQIIRIHFILLVILIFNYVLVQVTGFGLNIYLIDLLKSILYLTGIVLFFMNLRPFKIMATYYSLYVLTPTVWVIFYFTQSVLFGVLSYVLLTPVMPILPDYNDGNIKVYSDSKGFLVPCCRYHVSQDKLYVFEQIKGRVHIPDGVDFEKARIILKNDSALIYADTVYRAVMLPYTEETQDN
jgi:hypothetical protein